MSSYYTLASNFAGWLSGMCAILALLAIPAASKADNPFTCEMLCSSTLGRTTRTA